MENPWSGLYLVEPVGPHNGIIIQAEAFFGGHLCVHCSNFDSNKGLIWQNNPIDYIKSSN